MLIEPSWVKIITIGLMPKIEQNVPFKLDLKVQFNVGFYCLLDIPKRWYLDENGTGLNGRGSCHQRHVTIHHRPIAYPIFRSKKILSDLLLNFHP